MEEGKIEVRNILLISSGKSYFYFSLNSDLQYIKKKEVANLLHYFFYT